MVNKCREILDMKRMYLLEKIVFCACFLTLINGSNMPLLLRAELPPAPDTGTPPGKPTHGGTRPDAICKNTPQPLTALAAYNGRDLTVSSYPTFWFYMPYQPQDIRQLTFTIEDVQKGSIRTIYQTNIQLNQGSGIIKIPVLKKPEYALEVDKLYQWKLTVYCTKNASNDIDLVIEGWVKRIPMTVDLNTEFNTSQKADHLIYQDNQIWYDAINSLAEKYFANPDNSELNNAWRDLLEVINQESFSQEFLVESVLLSPQ